MSEPEARMFLEAETSFGLGLLQQLPLNESTIFSPISIALTLSLVHTGAKGNSKSQIASAICKDANDDQLKQHYSFLSNALSSPKNGVQVNIANKAFVNQKFPIKDSFLKAISSSYKADAQNLNFGDAAKSAGVINDFVKTNTKGKISELVKSSDINGDTAIFLVNALYLKADWEHEFRSTSTHDDDFHVKDGVTKKVPFMSESMVFRDYASDDKVQVLSLKYKDNAYRFNIFLPKEKFGLESYIKGLTAQKVQELLKNVKNTAILNLRVPKMKLEKEAKLIDMLKKLGVTDIFSNGADLGEMADAKVKISDATHKAIIEVDEQGTEAAAATQFQGVPMSGISGKMEDFIANHPYLFVLTFENHPIFIGTFYG